MCSHTTTYSCSMRYYYICSDLLLLNVCPRTTIYVSSYSCICVFYTTSASLYYSTCPVYVFSYYDICVLILLYMRPLYYICVFYTIDSCGRRRSKRGSWEEGREGGQSQDMGERSRSSDLYGDTYIVVWGHIYRGMRTHIERHEDTYREVWGQLYRGMRTHI